MSSLFGITRRNRQIERTFGPADPREVLSLIGQEALELMSRDENETLLSRLEDGLTRYPLSHNLRLVTLKMYRSLGRATESDQLLATSLALYPESPLLLRELINTRRDSLTHVERTKLEGREAELLHRAGLPPRSHA